MSELEPKAVRLSVVIPTFGHAERIAAAVGEVAAYLASRPFASEIVVVDDGSPDGTAEAAGSSPTGPVALRVLRLERNRGKGAAVREGVLAASGEVVLFSDDDLATPIGELDKVLAAIEAGADAVIGSRAHPGSVIRVRQRLPREWMGKAFNLLVRMFVLGGYRDTQCGFKAFRREAARAVFTRLRTEGFGFDVEVLVLCRELGFRVVEVPVTWCDARPSRLRLFGGSWGMLKDLWRIRRDARRRAKARKRGREVS
jgi:dolichyl-phosphate beta-glucosyltransferase